MTGWVLDRRLEKDSHFMASIGLCQMRLMNDSRYPWILLVPQRPGIVEWHDMTPLDQTMLTFELGLAAKALKEATGCHKINIGALGNHVRQLHVHVVARSEDDPSWPNPVWGNGDATAYAAPAKKAMMASILDRL